MQQGIELIVGLGNPGREYEQTRHNAGAWLVEALARQHHAVLSADPKFFGLTARINVGGRDLRLLIPTTFMNRSGQAVAALSQFFKIEPEHILVAHDELDLTPGTIRFKQGGGHGGHNGLRDIISCLGNNRNFYRLRIGIGHPGHASQVTGYVLGKAPTTEQQRIELAIDAALAALPTAVAGHWGRAMSQLNGFQAE